MKSDKHKPSEISPETLPAFTSLITSFREQKGESKRTIKLIDQVLRTAKKQILYLQKRKTQEKSATRE